MRYMRGRPPRSLGRRQVLLGAAAALGSFAIRPRAQPPAKPLLVGGLVCLDARSTTAREAREHRVRSFGRSATDQGPGQYVAK